MRTWRGNSERAYRMHFYMCRINSSSSHADPSVSLTGHPGFSNQPSQHQSPSIEDTIFEMNQTGLSPMWYDVCPSNTVKGFSCSLRRDPSPAYVDPRVGRPVMQARTPLPFQYVTEPPSVVTPTNTNPVSWEAPVVDAHMRGRGPASSTARYVYRDKETKPCFFASGSTPNLLLLSCPGSFARDANTF